MFTFVFNCYLTTNTSGVQGLIRLVILPAAISVVATFLLVFSHSFLVLGYNSVQILGIQSTVSCPTIAWITVLDASERGLSIASRFVVQAIRFAGSGYAKKISETGRTMIVTATLPEVYACMMIVCYSDRFCA